MSAARCRKPGCGCEPAAGSEYCSASCARAALGDIPPASCECGHAPCGGERATPSQHDAHDPHDAHEGHDGDDPAGA